MTTPTNKPLTPTTVKDDIMFDICMYEKELLTPNLKQEDIERIHDDIKRAEELFKTVE